MPITVEEKLSTQNDEENRSPLEAKKVYYPNNIGFPAPRLKNQYEFVLMGLQNQEQEALPRILKIFEEQKVRILTLSFFNDQSPVHFVMDVVSDFSNARCKPADLALQLNKLKKFAKIGEMKNSNQKIFAEFLFPLTFFGTVRALAIDSDRFLRLFSHISEELGEEKAKRILYEDGHTEGNEIVEAIREFFESDDNSDNKKAEQQQKEVEGVEEENYVLQNAKAFLRAAGWGTMSYSKMEGSDTYRVTIWDPPTDAEGEIVLGNYFLQGMIAGIIEPFVNGKEGGEEEPATQQVVKLSMMKESYDNESRTLTLYYINKNILEEETKGEIEQGKPVVTPPKQERIEEREEEEAVVVPVISQVGGGSGMQVQQLPSEQSPNYMRTTTPTSSKKDDEAEKQVDLVIQSIEKMPNSGNYDDKRKFAKIPEPKVKEAKFSDISDELSTNTGSPKVVHTTDRNRKNGFRSISMKDGRKTRRVSTTESDSDLTNSAEDAFWL